MQTVENGAEILQQLAGVLGVLDYNYDATYKQMAGDARKYIKDMKIALTNLQVLYKDSPDQPTDKKIENSISAMRKEIENLQKSLLQFIEKNKKEAQKLNK